MLASRQRGKALGGRIHLRANEKSAKTALVFLADGEHEAERLTYGELDGKARAIARHVVENGLAGERVLLLYPPGLGFVTAFLGCLYAGVVAVPAYPPRRRRPEDRLGSIARDCRPAGCLGTTALVARRGALAEAVPELRDVSWLDSEAIGDDAGDWDPPEIAPETPAFLQYTSGSTAAPKGVMVTHGNLLHNEAMIAQAFEQSPESVVVGWLPLYHDMGLIGNVLQPLYQGACCVLMSPAAFLQRPVRWLRAISRYGATTSGGPDFAYALCTRRISEQECEGLDLSSWRVAFSGAEPVRAGTLERFAERFAPWGFSSEVFFPCYGLAEATLLVCGGGVEHRAASLSLDSAALEAHAVKEVSEKEGVETKGPREASRRLVSCGRPASRQEVAIVDPETRRTCPQGRVGEIWVRGPSVAGGYWGRPELTEEVFQARLAGSGDGPFLRTGDLGFLRDGELYVTGRIKDLIILRGRNLYPQDVEATAERSHPDLRPACGAAFSVEAADEERLVVVHEVSRRAADPGAVCEAIRQAVAQEHEARVDDVVLVREATIPKTSSGKIRRRACRDAYLAGELRTVVSSRDGDESVGESPETPEAGLLSSRDERVAAVEDFLARQAGRLLELPASRLDPEKPLTAQGLDSLAAVELGHAALRELGSTAEPEDLLDGITLRELATQLATGTDAAPRAAVSSEAVPIPESFPLTRGQRALVFLERLAPQGGAYNIAAAARLLGRLDAEAFERALRRLGERHPLLRAVVAEEDGQLVHRITSRAPGVSRIEAASEEPPAALAELSRHAFAPFDLGQGPLLRVALGRRGPEEHELLLAVHHVVADFWSLTLMMRDLGELYSQERGSEESPGPDGPGSHYADFVRAQESWLASPEAERARVFWEKTLGEGGDPLELTTDRPRPAVQSHTGESVAFTLTPEDAEALRGLSRSRGATHFMTLVAAWGALLHRLSGQPEIRLGTPTAGRGEAGHAGVVGYFVNPIVLPQRFGEPLSFTEHLAAVRTLAMAAVPHQGYPFALLAESLQHPLGGRGGEPRSGRDPSRSPIFQAMFILQRSPVGPSGRPSESAPLAAFALGEGGVRMAWADLELESQKLPGRPVQFDLTLSIAELEAGGLAGSLQYSTALFDATTARRLAAAFVRLAAHAAASSDTAVGELSLFNPAERHQLLEEWNDTGAAVATDLVLPAAFSARVGRNPEAVAVVLGDEVWSYAELGRRSTRIAGFLAGLGAAPERVVGVALERSPELVAVLWGILKTGAAYLPLDPTYPAERLRFVARDSGASLILAEEGLVPLLEPGAEGGACRVLTPEAYRSAERGPLAPPAPRCRGDHPAYVIYTSGSTGRPKGVVVPHATVTNFFAGMDNCLDEHSLERSPDGEAGGRWLALTSVSFDISVLELLWTLTRGFEVVLRPSLTPAASGRLTSRVPDRGMDFSLMYFSSDVDADPAERYRLLMEGVKLADREGFAAVWTPERHFHAFGGLFPNPSVTSAAIAATTERLAIRAGSVVLPLHHPVRIAEEWSVVDNLSGGRVGLALASGWQPDDFVLAPDNYADRKDIMRRGIDTLRELWRGGSATFENGVGRETQVRILPPPVQAELPLWVTAAGSPKTFELAGETGSSLLTHLLGQGLDELAEKIRLYRAAAKRHGPGDGYVTLMLHTFVDEDAARVRETVREPFTRYLRTSFGLMKSLAPGQDLDAMTEDDMATLLARAFDRYFETSGLFGTPERCLEMVDRLKEIGVDEVACLIDFGVETGTVLESLETLLRVKNASAASAVKRSPVIETSIAGEVVRRNVTHLQCTPSLARTLVADPEAGAALSTLRRLMVGGEALPGDLATELGSRLGGRLLNMYGPTETTIWSSVARLAPSEGVTLGRAIANTSLVVADRRLAPVGLGAAGELLIGGRGVVRGYHGRGSLTAQRFVPDPFSKEPGSRLYRTGDLVRFLGDGSPQFLGRIDHQLKLRGHRIELGEVEAALYRQPSVREAVVAAREDRPGEARLVAYVVAATNGAGNLTEVSPEKRERLLAGRDSFRLPNGLDVAHLTSPQTHAIYREIYTDDVYRRHGVVLEDGATVFDVGANIGLFTLFVHQHCKDPRVFAFEPIPTTFDVLSTNVELFDLGVERFNIGISDREETVPFTFYPEMAGLSGRFSEGDREATSSIIRNWVERVSAERDVSRVENREIDSVVEEYLKAETFDCRVRPLSSVIAEHGIEAIDLLKVDVEGAELQVLAGIAAEDWPKIRQVVLEIHSKELLEKATAMLEARGFELVADEFIAAEDQVDTVYMLYAVRPGERREPEPAKAPVTADTLRAALSAQLPEPMVPSDVVMLERLPLLPNGKVDRRALPAPHGGATARRTPFVPPGEGLEQQIADVWRRLLGVDEVSVHDNFFESGGNSLLLMQAHGRLREALGREVSLVELMRHPTVSSLARHLGNGGSAKVVAKEQRKKVDDRMAKRRRAFGRKRRSRTREEEHAR